MWTSFASARLQAYRGARRSWLRRLLAAAAAGGLALTALGTGVFAAASYRNYPGGTALVQLHRRAGEAPWQPHAQELLPGVPGWMPAPPPGVDDTPRVVHVGNLAATTGASRFGERGAPWQYSKEEGLAVEALAGKGYSFVLAEVAEVCARGHHDRPARREHARRSLVVFGVPYECWALR